MALVPVTYEHQKKQRNELLKMKAKAMGGGDSTKAGGKVLFDVDAGEEGTFVTGIGIPGKKKNKAKKSQIDPEEAKDKFYDNIEDELLDRVDKTEREMQEMMKYLDAVDQTMRGDDLAQIRKMLSCTSSSVKHHTSAYSNIKSQVENMNKDAASALSRISQHNDDVMRLLKESEQLSREN